MPHVGTQCDGLGSMLGGPKVLSVGDSVFKTFTQLPTHNAVLVRLRFMHFGL